jgi:hypothetical protein
MTYLLRMSCRLLDASVCGCNYELGQFLVCGVQVGVTCPLCDNFNPLKPSGSYVYHTL